MDAKNGTVLITNQLAELLNAISEYDYRQGISLFHGGTIGQHFRHILEFYTCLIEGSTTGLVDYGSRKRNDAIAEQPDFALQTIEEVLEGIQIMDTKQSLQIACEFSDRAHGGPKYASSVGRELQYAFDHAVHHLAIIRMGLETHFPYIPVHPDLGIAPSTIRFRRVQHNH